MKRKNAIQPFSWHRQYLRQAAWTRSLRLHLYRKIGLAKCRNILELGCGTGAVTAELAERTGGAVCGLDRDAGALPQAQEHYPNIAVNWLAAEAAALPFDGAQFDLIVSHYFWMWVHRPDQVLAECLRVLKPGGCLMALAEPDYGKRTDYPDQLTEINEQLTKELIIEGADPFVGRKLEALFRKAGFAVEAGKMDQGWGTTDHGREFQGEWKMLKKVLKGVKGTKDLKEVEREAILNGTRRSTMPVYWAVGRKG